MLSKADSDRLTRVGAGTPMGNLFRRYWIPALLGDEVAEADGAPVRVRLLGEDLIAFRDSAGDVALVGAYCPHRRAPMFFGRNEECGLRCVYHGWKFDKNGTCVDMPSEPPDSLFKTKVTIDAYPTWEGGGIIWAYMGPRELQPPYPDHEFVRAPATHRGISKSFQDCNYLQALEGGNDPTHATILHNQKIGDLSFLRDYHRTAAEIELEETDYGFFYAGKRQVSTDEQWIRGYQFIMPSFHSRGQVDSTFWGLDKKAPTIDGHIWIPIDDETTWVYNFMYAHDPTQPISHEQFLEDEISMGRGPADLVDGYRLRRSRDNDYEIDRDLQKRQTFTGITGINTQDFALQECMETVTDRTKEHLGRSDRVIVLLRKLLLDSVSRVERGEAPRGIDPVSYRSVRAIDRKVRADVPWRELLAEDLVARF
jgi:phthalate 4,5-dioxygenase